MARLLELLLKRFVRRGRLTVTTARGSVFTVGQGGGRTVGVRFTSRAAELAVLLDPELRLGEAYMDGTLRVEQGTIADLLSIVLGQTLDGMPPDWARTQWALRYIYRRLQQFNPRTRSRRNVAHHYDLDGRLYSLFLDADRQYSCAYFETPDQSLDDAQLAKKRHLAAKLVLGRGKRVLDIGCGWGGLALYLADFCNANVTGITLSREQWARAGERAAERNLTDATDFRLQDYRDLHEQFDRIVSVGMLTDISQRANVLRGRNRTGDD
jgi:cyclopropane-fatty-acyl-phospholipid synthase